MLDRVLVVDDDPMTMALVSRFVSAAGLHCTTARDGAEALEMVRKGGFDLIIADWSMPVMDGLALCRAIRTDRSLPFVYIIILTAMSYRGRVSMALQSGADDVMLKPCDNEELEARLNLAKRITRLTRELDRIKKSAA